MIELPKRRRKCFMSRSVPTCILAISLGTLTAETAVEWVFGKQTPFSSLESQAEAYYEGRSDLENVRKALDILHAAVSRNPQDYVAWWRISEYDCYVARHVSGAQKKLALEAGVAAGRKAESLEPNRPEGHFWAGANEGLLAQASDFWRGLHLVDSVRDEMQAVMRIDPNYEQYGAERIMGRFYYRVPFFKGGNKQRSIRLLEDCLRRYPNNSLTMLYLADSYRAVGRRADARTMLERILHLGPNPAYGPELADNKAAAQHELSKYFHVREREK